MKTVLLLLAFAASQVNAQVIVGPDTTAESTLQTLGSYHAKWFQTFTVPEGVTHLKRFSFWWTGTVLDEEVHFVYGDIGRDEWAEGGKPFDSARSGWYTLDLMMPVTPHEVLFFNLIAANGSKHDPREGFDYYAQVRLTNEDQYAGGSFNSWYSHRTYEGDMLFQAEFTTTPEPATIALLGSGLAEIGAMARRRRKRDEN